MTLSALTRISGSTIKPALQLSRAAIAPSYSRIQLFTCQKRYSYYRAKMQDAFKTHGLHVPNIDHLHKHVNADLSLFKKLDKSTLDTVKTHLKEYLEEVSRDEMVTKLSLWPLSITTTLIGFTEEDPKIFTYCLVGATVVDFLFNRMAMNEKSRTEALLQGVQSAQHMPLRYNFPSESVIIAYLKEHPMTMDPYLSEKGIIQAVAKLFANKEYGLSGISFEVMAAMAPLGLKFSQEDLLELQIGLHVALRHCASGTKIPKDVPMVTYGKAVG